MNGDYVLYVIFAIMAIAFWNEKGSWLFAGYNMMSDKEKQKYDHKKIMQSNELLCRNCRYTSDNITYHG